MSQVFGDKKKTAAAPDATNTQPKKDPAYEPGTAEYDARMEKLQIAAGDKFSREREARLKAAAEKPADEKIELQRDQTGLIKAKRELSDFERAFAAARAEQGPGGTFPWVNPKTGKTEIKSTLYRGETPPAKKVDDVAQVQAPAAIEPNQPAADVQGTMADRNELADQIKISKAMQQAARRKDDLNRIVNQMQEPAGTPAPRTPEELASDELWKDIRAGAAGKSPEELSDAATKAKQGLDAAIAANQPADTATRSLPDTTSSNDTEDEIERIIKQSAGEQAELKESINTEYHADLHDILRLAGRLK